jgi:hypothetical protein
VFCRTFKVLLACALFAGTIFGQTFTFTTIDYPGAIATSANGINSTGEIVGWYQLDSSCTPSLLPVSVCTTHGFTDVNGTLATLDVPGATSTALYGINDNGDIVGIYTDSNGVVHGFLRRHTGTVTKLDYPGTDCSGCTLTTVAMGINKNAKVAGMLYSIFGQNPSDGFTWSGQTFNKVDVQNTSTGLRGISNTGIVVGQVFSRDFWDGLLKSPTDTDIFYRNRDGSTTGINSNTDIVGYDVGQEGYYAANVEGNEAGSETEHQPKYETVEVPGSSLTQPNAINDVGGIAGTYQDSNGFHGFSTSATGR